MERTSLAIRVMSFNVRFDTNQDAPELTWPKRKDAAVGVVERAHADVVGLQETLSHQLDDVRAALPRYDVLARSRDGRGSEATPILYDRRRFDTEDAGHFWLSETPDEEGSRGWDAPGPRICSWAALSDRATGETFAVFNTHLTDRGPVARARGAELIAARIGGGRPSVLTGDLNSGVDGEPFAVLAAAGLRDAVAERLDAPGLVTYHDYGRVEGRRIDFVLCDDSWRVTGAEIVRDRPGGTWPSDHYPVVVDLVLDGGEE